MSWFLIRHAQTNFNAEQRYQGQLDEAVLSAEGVRDTERIRESIRNLSFKRCYCSPLMRARQTAELLLQDEFLKACQYPDRLMEVGIRAWEGRLKRDIRLSEPNSLLLWRNFPHLFRGADGEQPLLELYQRIRTFLATLEQQDEGRLVIAHDHVNRAIIGSLLDLPIELHYAFPQSNSSISLVSRHADTGLLALQGSNLPHSSGVATVSDAFQGPRLILVRHGVTEANERRIYQGSTDYPLSERGRDQVQKLGMLFRSFSPALVISSTLRRASSTAAGLGLAGNPRVLSDERLNEFNYGRWQGLQEVEVEQRHPEDIKALRLMTKDQPIPGGEKISGLIGRISSLTAELWAYNRNGGTVVVVAHDVVIRSIIALTLRLSLRHLWMFPITNGAYSEIRLNEMGSPVLFRHNVMPGSIFERNEHKYL